MSDMTPINLDGARAVAFPWADVAGALFAARGITEGLWFVGVSLNFAGVTNDWANDVTGQRNSAPTALVGIQSLVIAPASAPGPMVFDAAALVGKSFGQATFTAPEAAIKATKTEAKSIKRRAAAKAPVVKRKG